MNKVFSRLIVIFMIALLAVPAPVWTSAAPLPGPIGPAATVNFTILHTNDFHGQLETVGTSNPGIARLAQVVNNIRTSVGTDNVLLLDAGDEMQGSLLSNLQHGVPVIAAYNLLGYNAATFGNHEFDWGQTVLQDRIAQANHPYLASNLVVNDTGNCSTAGWTSPSWTQPYEVFNVGTVGSQVRVGVIGVTSQETPYITIASATDGLCFKDAADSILHYYDALDAVSDVIVVLSHLGLEDGGYGYGITVYGDKTLAAKLNTAGKPVSLIIGGHSHIDVTTAATVGTTKIAQAYYNGRRVGRADFSFDTVTGTATVNWSSQTVPTAAGSPADAAMAALVATYSGDTAYQALINQVIGYTNVGLVRNYNGESTMANFLQDAVYNFLNEDANPANDVDMVFNNAGGIRADITAASYPYTLTYGSLFNVLPFGNQTIVGDMTGAQIQDLLNQSATLFKGALQPGGIEYKFYMYTDTLPGPQPWAWGAYDINVLDKASQQWVPLDMDKTYKVATNEFLAPAGQDGYAPFKYMTNIAYYGDMLNAVNAWVAQAHATPATAYNGGLDGRITRDGTAAGGSIIPLTVLHHNDSHGNLVKGSFVGYTQLVTMIKEARAHNPNRNMLLSSGDNIQGDAMMYYYRMAPQGIDTDGNTLPITLTTHPLIAAFNTMNYDAYTLGNHEFNFGNTVMTSVLGQAAFPVLQANLADSGAYGLASVPVQPYVEKTVGPENINVAILGIGNHRVPNYELPSNITGLTFNNPITVAQSLAPDLKANNDLVIALTHIGFTTNPKSLEVDNNVDTILAAQTPGLDVVIGGHSHTNPTSPETPYKYLPTVVGNPDNTPVLVSQAYRYNNTLGTIVVGMRAKAGGGYEVVSRAGRTQTVAISVAEDSATKTLLQPYVDQFNAYNNMVVGETTAPIDALQAYTQETNGANMQADAAVFELAENGINVDFHISGAMSNRAVAAGATPAAPVTLKISDMFTLMPYENSLVTMNMNGPQLKAVLERAYRNYFYYKYYASADPKYAGYSYYTTCMIDINKLGQIKYNDTNPALPNGNNVISLSFDKAGQTVTVDFDDAATFYHVSTVNYLAAGSCNFNDDGVTLWPLNQIVNDTQFYVRDAVIHYLAAEGTVSPAIEGRLQFITDITAPTVQLDSQPANPTNLTTASFTFSGADEVAGSGLRRFECKLDGGDWAACTSPAAYTSLTDGSHTFAVRSMDMAYNVSTTPASFTWLVDAAAPTVQILMHPPVAVNVASASFAFAAEDNAGGSGVALLACKLDDGAFAACTSPLNLTDLAEGAHTLQIKAEDGAGNVSALASFSWTVDTVVPAVPEITGPANNSVIPFGDNYNKPTFTGTGEVGATAEVWLQNGATQAANILLCSAVVDAQGDWSCQSQVALPSGPNSVLVTLKDAVGNVSSAVTLDFTVLYVRYLGVIGH